MKSPKTTRNARLLHFLKLLDSKNEREHETVAFFEASKQKLEEEDAESQVFR